MSESTILKIPSQLTGYSNEGLAEQSYVIILGPLTIEATKRGLGIFRVFNSAKLAHFMLHRRSIPRNFKRFAKQKALAYRVTKLKIC